LRGTILTTEMKCEQDVVATRQCARQIAAAAGFDLQDQTRIATAVSEVARNAFQYAGGGKAEFALDDSPSPMLCVSISDNGPGIRDLRSVLDGTYTSDSGMGIGIVGSRRLTDHFEIASRPGSTTVTLGKRLPPDALPITMQRASAIARELGRLAPPSPLMEARQQNQELLRTLEALRNRQAEIERLNAELAETNRGVVALYAELDDKAKELRKVSDQKSRFLSNISHELRTPLNSIIMLARMMGREKDGPLGQEYLKQAAFISQSAESLLEMVNDLLDLAKIEAGKAEVHAATFSVEEMFSGLRGMFRPLLAGRPLELLIEAADPELIMHSDAHKVSQILRNLVSNAIKFTEQGEVRVRSEVHGDGIVFSVSDTGVGISAEGQKRLFQDFSQLRDEYRKGIKGTGLGLSISRQLAELLGGKLDVQSEVGAGSTFTATLPLRLAAESELSATSEASPTEEMESNRV
jgi:signal transduction histidine kinase